MASRQSEGRRGSEEFTREWLRHFEKRRRLRPRNHHASAHGEGDETVRLRRCDRDHPEFVRELKQVLAAEHAKSTPRVVEAAIRLLCHRKPPDFVKKLINLAPSLVSLDENLRHTLVDSLAAMAQKNEGVATELVAATKSPTAIQRKHSLGRKLETVARPGTGALYEITRTGHEVWHADANARSCEGLKDGRASRSCDHKPVHLKFDSPTQCG